MSVEAPEIHKQKNLIAEAIASRLEQRLKAGVEKLRGHQVRAIQKLIAALKSGITEGLFKHPTGAGKTFLFGEILKVAGLPSLVLVPRNNLIKGTSKDLINKVGHKAEDIKAIDLEATQSGGKNAGRRLQNILAEPGFSESSRVIIMTYQSFLSVHNSNPKLIDDMFKDVKILICDEAHRSMGEKTSDSILSRKSEVRNKVPELLIRKPFGPETPPAEQPSEVEEEEYSEEDAKEAADEDKALEVIKSEREKLINLRFTATPTLSKKKVHELYNIPVIDFVTVGELVEDGTLIMPTEIDIGKAIYRTEAGLKLTEQNLDRIANKFKMEDGRDVASAVIEAYKKKRELVGGYLPAVAFCRDKKEADNFCNKLNAEKGITAVCCTSDPIGGNNVSAEEAQDLIEKQGADVIVTVSKVAEGWDVPTLRCAMVLTPMRSPARILQGIGRIMRSLSPDSSFPAKKDAWIIQPKWVLKVERRSTERQKGAGGAEKIQRSTSGTGEQEDPILFESQSFTKTLYDGNELKLGELKKMNEKVPFDPDNDEMLRALFGTPETLIVNGRGSDISKVSFSSKAYGWVIDGKEIMKQLDKSLVKNQRPGIFTEALALRLWPKEAQEFMLDLENKEHLKLLIRGPEYLIHGGKGIEDWRNKEFTDSAGKWLRYGREIPLRDMTDTARGPEQALELSKWLWPKETEELLKNSSKRSTAIENQRLDEEVLEEMKSVFDFDQYGYPSEPLVEIRNRLSDTEQEFRKHVFKYTYNNTKKEITGFEVLRKLRLLEPGDNVPNGFIKLIYKKLFA